MPKSVNKEALLRRLASAMRGQCHRTERATGLDPSFVKRDLNFGMGYEGSAGTHTVFPSSERKGKSPIHRVLNMDTSDAIECKVLVDHRIVVTESTGLALR